MPLFSSRVRRPGQSAARNVRPIEPLESRRLMTVVPVAGNTPADVTGAAGSTQTVDLTRFVDDDAVTSHTVRMSFSTGSVDITTFDTEVPLNVQNFLRYVRGEPGVSGYEGAYFHRFIDDFVLQGGSFYPRNVSQSSLGDEVDETGQPTVTDEVPVGQGRSNTRGTLAFARLPVFNDANGNGFQDPGEQTIPGGGPNSATSGFFFNLADNGANLNFQNGGFDVFGETTTGTTAGGQATNDPIADVLLPLAALPATQQVITDAVVLEPTVTFSAISSNPSAVTVTNPTGPDGKLQLQYLGAVGSTSQITVTATQAGQPTPVTLTFDATVGGTAGLDVALGGTSGAQSVTFTDADGTVSTVTLKGPGTATVSLEGTGLTQAAARNRVNVTGAPAGISNLVITGASAATAVTITGRGGNGVVDLDGFSSDGPLKSVAAKPTAATGAVNVAGAVGKLDLGSTSNATITLGGSAGDRPGTVTLGDATATSITAAAPLKSVTASSFVAGQSGPSTITAPALDALTARGDMTQNVSVTGAVKKVTVGGNMSSSIQADTVGAVAVRGAVANSGIIATRAFNAAEKPIGKVTVGGAVSNTVVRAAGNVTSLTAGSLSGVTVYAGVADSVNAVTLPTTAAQFASPATIGTVTSKTTTADTNIAASTLGKLNLGTLTTTNNGTPFGVAADQIASLTATIGTSRGRLSRVTTQEQVDAQVGSTALGDFDINVI